MFRQHAGFDPPQIEALAARQHRDRHLADLGRREDELGVRGWLFEGLEQRVERRRGQHVHFVEDVDFVARARRGVTDRIVDLAHVVDAVVGRGIHFEHVDVPAFHDRLTVHTQARHVDRRGAGTVGTLIVQRARDDPRSRGFSDPPNTCENPGLRDATGLERVR